MALKTKTKAKASSKPTRMQQPHLAKPVFASLGEIYCKMCGDRVRERNGEYVHA